MGNEKIDPISAIKARIASMTEIEKQAFAKETGVDISAINIMRYDVAVKYCKDHNISLSPEETIWANYNKAKEDWNTYHDLYVQANDNYHDLHNIKEKTRGAYEEAKAKAVEENGGEKLTTTQDNKIRRDTNYTSETIKNANEAEDTAMALLDKCWDAVGAQRGGLILGTLYEGFNFNA